MFIQQKVKENKLRDESSASSRAAQLSTNWKTTVDDLDGDRVRAAYVCPDFKIILSPDELAELK